MRIGNRWMGWEAGRPEGRVRVGQLSAWRTEHSVNKGLRCLSFAFQTTEDKQVSVQPLSAEVYAPQEGGHFNRKRNINLVLKVCVAY